MLTQSNNKLIVCFIVSFVLHCLFFGVIFYHKQNKQLFLQVPIEIDFYSPVQEFNKKSIVNDKQNKPVEKKVEPKKKEVKKEIVKKEDIVLNSKKKKEEKKKEEKKEEVVPKEQEKQEENKEQQSQPQTSQPQTTGSGFMQNKGIMLENADFKYSYYTTAIVKKISRYWQWSNVYSSYRAVVYFRIEKDGFVKVVEIKESSGDEGFDDNAIRAVQLASPFAPLPEGYNQDHLGVYFEFKFR